MVTSKSMPNRVMYLLPHETQYRREEVELRELSLEDFQGREALQLHNLDVTTDTATYQLKVLGDRVLLLKTSLNP